MADLDMDFKPDDVPADERDLLPAGEYDLQVIESELKDTKSGEGQQLVLTLEVVTGPHTNRRVWDRLNIRHTSADAQRIAQRALADLCLAIGIQSLRNSEELHFKPFKARVTIAEDKKGQYGPQNRVRYKSGGAAVTARPTQAAIAAPAPTSGAKPWQKRPAA